MNGLSPISSGVFSRHDQGIRQMPNKTVTNARKFEYGNLNILGIMLGHETFRWFNELGSSTISPKSSQIVFSMFGLATCFLKVISSPQCNSAYNLLIINTKESGSHTILN
ncbi:MAG: hypothetical protein ACON35_05075 [Candidatus Marinamargulisbacteria bacterium]